MLGCTDHEFLEFAVLRHIGQERSIDWTPNFGKVNFKILRALVSRIPSKRIIRDRGPEHRWQIFKDILRTQEKLARLNRDLLVKITSKRELHRQGKQRKVT